MKVGILRSFVKKCKEEEKDIGGAKGGKKALKEEHDDSESFGS
jgi:hypothetical protein